MDFQNRYEMKERDYSHNFKSIYKKKYCHVEQEMKHDFSRNFVFKMFFFLNLVQNVVKTE